MRIMAMRVVAAEEHPNADTLRVYRLVAPELDLQLVANLEQIYSPGQVVAVALVGAELEDGTRVRKARLRGIDSFGMALGLHEAEPGADLTWQYGRAPVGPPPGLEPIKWSSIEGMQHVRGSFEVRRQAGEAFRPPRVTYKAKVKLHGTNGGIQLLRDGTVAAQGRNQVLTVGEDNCGFAAWVEQQKELLEQIQASDDLVIFGEWCGPGIQKGVAVSTIPRRVFAVFAVQLGTGRERAARLLVDPAGLRELLPRHPRMPVLPWYGDEIELDWNDREQLERGAEQINKLVAEVARCDPWVRETFGVDGAGEGLVLYPTHIHVEGPDRCDALAGAVDRDTCTELMFKAKGQRHRVTKQRKPAQVDPEVARGIEEFIRMFITEARLEQGLVEACGGTADPRKTGEFLRWVGQDVQKEGQLELQASGLTWRQVQRAVTARAREWFMGR